MLIPSPLPVIKQNKEKKKTHSIKNNLKFRKLCLLHWQNQHCKNSLSFHQAQLPIHNILPLSPKRAEVSEIHFADSPKLSIFQEAAVHPVYEVHGFSTVIAISRKRKRKREKNLLRFKEQIQHYCFLLSLHYKTVSGNSLNGPNINNPPLSNLP